MKWNYIRRLNCKHFAPKITSFLMHTAHTVKLFVWAHTHTGCTPRNTQTSQPPHTPFQNNYKPYTRYAQRQRHTHTRALAFHKCTRARRKHTRLAWPRLRWRANPPLVGRVQQHTHTLAPRRNLCCKHVCAHTWTTHPSGRVAVS